MKRALALFASLGLAVVALMVTSSSSSGQGTLGPAPLVNVTTGGGLTKTGQKVGMTLCAAGQTPVMNGGGTAWTCGSGGGAGDIEGVTAGAGLTGGGTTGTVTLDAACVTNSLVCNANDIGIASRDFGSITVSSSGTVMTIDASSVTSAMLNITATSACAAGQYLNAINSNAAGSCASEVGDISGVTANSPLSGGGASGAVTVGMANGDRGDITLTTGTQTGDTWNIDNSTITSAKLNITTTSCGAGNHVSAISAGGVGTCSASGALSGLTSGTLPVATSSSTLGDSTIVKSGTDYVLTGTLTTTSNFATSNGYVSAAGGSGWVIATQAVYAGSGTAYLLGAGLNFALATNGTATGCINCVGYNEGTTQTRSLRIADGTGSAGGDTIAFFDGTDRSVDFSAAVNIVGDVDVDGDLTLGTTTSDFVQVAGFLEIDATLGVDGATRLGDANGDSTTIWGKTYYSGTAPSLSSCTGGTIASTSTDARGIITFADAGSSATCTLTFSGAYSTNKPSCNLTLEDCGDISATQAFFTSVSTSAFVIAPLGGGDLDGYCVHYRCDGML